MLGWIPNNRPPVLLGNTGNISFNGMAIFERVVEYSAYSPDPLGISMLKESLPPPINTQTRALNSGSAMVVAFATAAAASPLRLTSEDNRVAAPTAAQLACPKNLRRVITS